MRTKYTKEVLEPIASSSNSMAEVLDKLGLKKGGGGNYTNIGMKIRYYGIDISHFQGSNWAKGKTHKNNDTIKRIREKIRTSNEDVFCENSGFHSRSRIKKRLIEDFGWDDECSICHLSDWLENPITLHLDHINGTNNDHRLENLRILCPNCHSQTETYAGRNNKKKKKKNSNKRISKQCLNCNKKIGSKSKRCKKCGSIKRGKENRKVKNRPSKDELEKMIEEMSWTAIGKEYGVSDNAIRKWAKQYEII